MTLIRDKFPWIRHRGVLCCALLLSTITVLSGLVIALGKTNLAPLSTNTLAGHQGSATPATPPGQSATRLEAERTTLRASGFEPNEITRPAGRFLLAVNDRSGLQQPTFVLLRDSGGRVHESRAETRTRKNQWRQVVNLPPGRYVLREVSHPEWTCRILLTANESR